MRKMLLKKLVSSIVITCLLFSSFGIVYGASASVTSDIKGHWAEAQIATWMDKGLIIGYEDGSFKPDHEITRAEFIALINRSFGFTEEEAISFSDVIAGNWAYAEVAKAVKARYITGYSDGTIGASKPISRQEVAVIVDRILGLSTLTDSETTTYTDATTVALWAKDAVEAIVAEGVMTGYAADNSFKPAKSITRAEAVATLDRAIAKRAVTYNNTGTYGPVTGVETINKNVVVNVSGVTLQNMVINGDLLLAEGIGNGDAFLNNVKVTGTVTVQGGGENSIHFNNSILIDIIIDKKLGTGIVRIVSEGTTTVALVIVNSPVNIQESNSTGAGFGNINISASLPAGSTVSLMGSFTTVNVSANQIIVNVPTGSTVNSLLLDAVVKMLGQGTIVAATINVPGTTFEKPAGTTPAPAPAPIAPTTPGGGSVPPVVPVVPVVPEVPEVPEVPTDTPPTVISAAFTGGQYLVITFSEAVNATTSNFSQNIFASDDVNHYYPFRITGISGSGTSTITLTLDYYGDEGDTSNIAISGVTDLAGNTIASIPSQFINKSDNTGPTVMKLGDGIEPFEITQDGEVTLTFSELVSSDSKDNIEAALSAFSDLTWTDYSWSDLEHEDNTEYNELSVTASVYASVFTNDVYVDVEDEYGNISVDVLLIDTSRDSQPIALSAAFTSATTLAVKFNEPVTAAMSHFTPGDITHINGMGTASSYQITGIAGLGTSVITLTVVGKDDNDSIVPLVGGDSALVSIGAGVKDLTEQFIEPVVSLPVTHLDTVKPTVVSAAFTSATEIEITFNEPVIAVEGNFSYRSITPYYGHSRELVIESVDGSGTNTIILTVSDNLGAIGVGYSAYVYAEGIVDLVSNSISPIGINIKKLDTTAPTATALGNSNETFTIAAGESVTLTFSEEISIHSLITIEEAITNAASAADLTYVWFGNKEVTITAGVEDVTFADSVYVDGIYDIFENQDHHVLLITSKDTVEPTLKSDVVFNYTSEIELHFSEAVTASLSDFTVGPIFQGDDPDSALVYQITDLTGSGTDTIYLKFESIDNYALDDGDTSTIKIGPGLKDLSGNSIIDFDVIKKISVGYID